MVEAPPRAATQDEIRRHNLARITRHLHSTGAITRSDLVSLTGLNRSTVGTLVSELADAGLVREVAGPAGAIGRPSLMPEPIAESVVVMAFEIRVEQTVGALIGLGGKVFQRTVAAHRRDRYRPAAAVKQIASMAHGLLQAGPQGAIWVGTGVSVAGGINRFSGLVRIAPT
ncbi:MAG: sugar kinase, partial [Actinomycetales bacterium]